MKRILFLLLSVSIVLSCFVSCNHDVTETSDTTTGWQQTEEPTNTSGKEPPIEPPEALSPSDEETAFFTITSSNSDGIKLEVTLHGYKSESLGKDFYVKSNEYVPVDVKVTNTSDISVYQFLPTYCRESAEPHNHEISFSISNKNGYFLNSSSFGFACPDMIDVWEIESGKSYEWSLKLAAGKIQSQEYDLPADGKEISSGIKLYDSDIYTNASCIFNGEIGLDYAYENLGTDTRNEYAIRVELSVEFVYVSELPDVG